MSDNKKFIDTNVLVYVFANKEPEKQQKAKEILKEDIVVSTQVINELASVLTGKKKYPVEYAIEVINRIRKTTDIKQINEYTSLSALKIKGKYGYGYYDSLIIATALANKCRILITEDMQDGQVIEGKLTIKNNF